MNPVLPPTETPQVSVVVPVYRNAATVQELHRRLRRVLQTQGLEYELIFVEDACPDGSLEPLIALAEEDPRVGVLSLARNVGQHRAVLAGLAHARGRKIVVMDADLQDPPEAIPVLLARLGDGYSAAFAGKHGEYEPPARLLTGRAFKALLQLLCGVPADAGMYFAIDRRMAEQLLAFHAPAPYLVAMIGCAGLPLASAPVRRARRPSGRSAYNTWKRLKIGVTAIAWTLAWKWLPGARRASQPRAGVPLKAAYGVRFTPAPMRSGER